jgi:hypothetical protein
MPLAAGARLGPYEILGLIGALRLRSGQAGGPVMSLMSGLDRPSWGLV